MPAAASIKENSLRSILCRPVFIAAVALLFRLLLLVFLSRGLSGPSTPYVNETTNIASSIVAGRGFASPFQLAPSGATAWLCPIFPYLVAFVFRVWGSFTQNSLLVIQGLNCLFASLSIFPIYFAAKRSFGSLAAVGAAWAWVVLPFAWWTPIQDIWDTSLTAFFLAVVFWATLAIRERHDLPAWLAYGALWAIAALINAAVLSLLPFFFGWLLWQQRRFSFSLAAPSAALLVFLLLLIPWTIRNHHSLGKWIPLRSNFGLELWLGNNPAAGDTNSFAQHPLWNRPEAAEFQQLGEVNYIAAKQRAALTYMQAHPSQTARAIAARVWSNWFAVTDRVNAQWSTSPAYVKALFVLNFFMLLLGALGMIIMLRENASEALLYFIVVLIFPLPYYVTHTLVRYRFPIEPILTILAVYGFFRVCAWATGRSWTDAPQPVSSLRPAR